MPEQPCPTHLLEGLKKQEQKNVRAAHAYAQSHLLTVKRRTGKSYAFHGTEVALTIKEIVSDASLIAVALLHDLPLAPQEDELLMHAPLNPIEKQLVRGMHDLRRLHIDENTRDLDKVIIAFSGDERILLLRMAHRLNDVRHLERFDPTLQKQIARETLHMYTSIAGRLGMHAWRFEMEETCFGFLQPKAAKSLQKKIQSYKKLDNLCLRHIGDFIAVQLRNHNIHFDMSTRIKGLYSTYRKMIIKRKKFEELTDRLALRIILDSIEDCYKVLGIIHTSLHPIPGKLKDYIGAPKENGYRSIHTVIYPLPSVTEQPIEIQIRTQEMHQICEFGIAMHTNYKHGNYSLQSLPSRVDLFRNLESLREEARSPKSFATALRTYFSEEHIVLFDTKSNLYHLKKPVTAFDFACHVYGKRALRLSSVRVNGREQMIDMLLSAGDTVEPIFSKDIRAKKDWIRFCHFRWSKEIIKAL